MSYGGLGEQTQQTLTCNPKMTIRLKQWSE